MATFGGVRENDVEGKSVDGGNERHSSSSGSSVGGRGRTIKGNRQWRTQCAWLGEGRGSFFPLRGVLRLRIGVRRLGNLERPRRRDPTGRGWGRPAVFPVLREPRARYA